MANRRRRLVFSRSGSRLPTTSGIPRQPLFEILNEPHDQLIPLWNGYLSGAAGDPHYNPKRCVLIGTAGGVV